MRLYLLVEAGDPEAIDVNLCEQDAQTRARGLPPRWARLARPPPCRGARVRGCCNPPIEARRDRRLL